MLTEQFIGWQGGVGSVYAMKEDVQRVDVPILQIILLLCCCIVGRSDHNKSSVIDPHGHVHGFEQ